MFQTQYLLSYFSYKKVLNTTKFRNCRTKCFRHNTKFRINLQKVSNTIPSFIILVQEVSNTTKLRNSRPKSFEHNADIRNSCAKIFKHFAKFPNSRAKGFKLNTKLRVLSKSF